MTFDKDIFAREVYKARHDMRLSQEKFAALIGVNKNTVSSLENGKSDSPGAETIMAICHVTGKSPNELLGWRPQPRR